MQYIYKIKEKYYSVNQQCIIFIRPKKKEDLYLYSLLQIFTIQGEHS